MNDTEIVKQIIEKELLNNSKVSQEFVIEEIKNSINSIHLVNKIWVEDSSNPQGRLTNNGRKNRNSGARKIFRNSLCSLKKYFVKDSEGFISKRLDKLKYIQRDYDYKKVVLSIISDEWKNSRDIFDDFKLKVTDKDAIQMYDSAKKNNSLNKEDKIILGKNKLYSNLISKMVKSGEIKRQGEKKCFLIKLGNLKSNKNWGKTLNYTKIFLNLLGDDWSLKEDIRKLFSQEILDEDARFYYLVYHKHTAIDDENKMIQTGKKRKFITICCQLKHSSKIIEKIEIIDGVKVKFIKRKITI